MLVKTTNGFKKTNPKNLSSNELWYAYVYTTVDLRDLLIANNNEVLNAEDEKVIADNMEDIDVYRKETKFEYKSQYECDFMYTVYNKVSLINIFTLDGDFYAAVLTSNNNTYYMPEISLLDSLVFVDKGAKII
jgi:hypothetical protein